MSAEPVRRPDSARPQPTPHTGAERPLQLPPARLTALAGALSVPDGGFTVDPVTGADVTTGCAVSVDPYYERVYDRPVTGDDLAAYLTSAQRAFTLPRRVLGGWRDPESGRVHLDVSVVVETLAEALVLGRSAGQLAVFDLDAGKSVPVPDGGDAAVIPLRKSPGISGEQPLGTVTGDTDWRYHHKRRGRRDLTITGHITYVGGAEGERIRGRLAATLAELLEWAKDHRSREDREAA